MTIHSCLDIEGAIRRPAYWRKLFKFNGRTPTTDQFRAYLLDETRQGRTAISLGCPSPNPDGTCPGHESKGDPASAARGGKEQ